MSSAPKGSSPLKVILLVLVFIGAPCVIGGILVFNIMRQGMKALSENVMPVASCAVNMTQARDAIKDYAQQKGTFPPADKWQDLIEPIYRKKIQAKLGKEAKGEVLGTKLELTPFEAGKPWGCTVGKDASGKVKMTGIAYNTDLAGKKLADFPNEAQTIVLFEVPKPQMNLAQKFVKPDNATAPSMFGKPRNWMLASLTGDVDFQMKNGSSSIEIKDGKSTQRVEIGTGSGNNEADAKSSDGK